MSAQSAHADGSSSPLSPSIAELHRRCLGLGLPAWRLDDEAHILTEPTDFGPSGAFLRAKPLQAELVQAGRIMLAETDPQPTRLFVGATLVPIAEQRRSQRRGLTLVLCLGPDALESEAFVRICREARLEPASTSHTLREHLAGLTEGGPRHDPAQIRAVLDWARTDLARADDNQRTINQFSAKLMQSYEEVSLMYRLGQSMRGLSDPVRLMRQTCSELKAVLPFAWVSAAFSDQAGVVGSLRGRALYAGMLPTELARFETRGRAFVDSQLETWTKPVVCSGIDQGELQAVQSGDGTADSPSLGLTSNHPQPPGGARMIAAPLRHHGRIIGALLAGDKEADDAEPTSAELKLLGAASDFLSVFHENLAAFAEQKSMFLGTVQALTASIDAKDRYTCGHSQRVALLARQLAMAVGLPENEVERAHVTGLVHDVGKIGIPEAVLGKPGKLTDEQFDQIKQHPVIGDRILADIPPLEPMLPGVRHHHERIDGRGYPSGLAGEQIPFLGRLIAVADTFDAMSSTRSYRPAMPRAKVLTEIQRSAGTQLDANLTAAFLKLDLSDYDAMLSHHQDEHLRYAA